jgi:hypothetical protein
MIGVILFTVCLFAIEVVCIGMVIRSTRKLKEEYQTVLTKCHGLHSEYQLMQLDRSMRAETFQSFLQQHPELAAAHEQILTEMSTTSKRP